VTIAEALAKATIPALDAEVLLAHVLQRSRAFLLAHPKGELTGEQERLFRGLAARRAAAEPVAYLTGTREFAGHPFSVNPSVLIPRPATEALVELALNMLQSGTATVREADSGIVAAGAVFGPMAGMRTVVDIGTGSGCIGITIALAMPHLHIIGTDIQPDALRLAAENARGLGCTERCEWRQGSLLEPLADLCEPFLIISNPPYIPEGTHLMEDVQQYEPAAALFAGPDGMAVLRPLLHAARQHPFCRGIAVECLSGQWNALATDLC